MSKPTSLLAETLDRWYNIRRGLIKEISVFPPARMSFRPTLETRSVLELVQHALAVSIMTVEELVREDTNFHRATFSQLINVYAPNVELADSQEKLIDLLVEQYKDADGRFRNLGELFLLQLITRHDGSKGTRFDILEEAIEHEMYHRGQLTVYARLLGLEPALSRESAQHPYTRFTDRV